MKLTATLLMAIGLMFSQITYAKHSTNWECDHYNSCHTSIYIFSDQPDVSFKAKAYKVKLKGFYKDVTAVSSATMRGIMDVFNAAASLISSAPPAKFADAVGSAKEPNKHIWDVSYEKSYTKKSKPVTDDIKRVFNTVPYDIYPYYVEFRVVYRKIDSSMKDNGYAEHYAFKFEVDDHKKGYIEYFPWEEDSHTLAYGYKDGKLSFPAMF